MRTREGLDVIGSGLLIYLLLIGFFMLAPIIFVVLNSFNESAYGLFPPQGFSLHWFNNALTIPQFRKGIVNSLKAAGGASMLSLVLGTLASRALTRHRFFAKEAVRSFFFSPMIVPRIVLGCALFLFFIRINKLGYTLFGSMTGLVMGHAILSLPIVIVIVSANLLSINPAIEEAAMDLGANSIKTFLFVTLPQMRVGLIVAALFAFITSFDEVDVSLFLTRPSINTLPIEMFVYAENYQDPTLAAISALLIGFSVVLVVVAIFILRTQEYRRLLERK